jgi:O-antigen/teichoic acid export membrane protein
MLTRLSELSPYDAYKKTVARLPLTLLAFAGLTAVSIAALPFAIPFVLSARYLPSVNLTQLMLAATFASLTGAYFETYLVSQRKKRVNSRHSRFVFPVTFLGTLPLGAHYFGVLGIIFAKMIAGAVYSIVAVALARRVQLA